MIRRLASVAAGAAALAGLAIALLPQHAASIAALAAATVAVVAASFLLVLAGPFVTARPEPWPAPAGARLVPPLDPQGLRDARRTVAARRAAGTDVRALLDELARPPEPGGPR